MLPAAWMTPRFATETKMPVDGEFGPEPRRYHATPRECSEAQMQPSQPLAALVEIALRHRGKEDAIALLDEGCVEAGGGYRDKKLGVWRCADIPSGLR
jgi:hypothetical protein